DRAFVSLAERVPAVANSHLIGRFLGIGQVFVRLVAYLFVVAVSQQRQTVAPVSLVISEELAPLVVGVFVGGLSHLIARRLGAPAWRPGTAWRSRPLLFPRSSPW